MYHGDQGFLSSRRAAWEEERSYRAQTALPDEVGFATAARDLMLLLIVQKCYFTNFLQNTWNLKRCSTHKSVEADPVGVNLVA